MVCCHGENVVHLSYNVLKKRLTNIDHTGTSLEGSVNQVRLISLGYIFKVVQLMILERSVFGNARNCISCMFMSVAGVHSRPTRQTCKKLFIFRSVSMFARIHYVILRYTTDQISNNLPADVKKVSSAQVFKSNCLNIYFS